MLADFSRRATAWILAGTVPLALIACASAPQSRPAAAPSAQNAGARAASHALKMVGRVYRAGGSSPETGFDCSGLVQFSYRQAGLAVPRSTEEQLRAGAVVRAANLRRGDLVFFDQEGKKNSHVGIYLGNGEFVHAPSSGKRVRSDRFDSPYWKKYFSGARRFAI